MPAQWSDANTEIRPLLEIQWDSSTWTDETQYMKRISGVQSALELWQYAQGREFQPWTAEIELVNQRKRFNPYYTSGPLYTHIQPSEGLGYGIPVRFSVELKDGMSYIKNRLFTGYIEKLDGTSYVGDTARVSCMDNHLPFIQTVESTTMSLNQRTDQWLNTLKTLGGVGTTSYDTGMFVHPFLWLNQERISHEMSLVAQCELGAVWFDVDGIHTFENFEAWYTKTKRTVVQRAFTNDDYTDISIITDWNNIHDTVSVIYDQRSLGSVATVYSLKQPQVVMPNSSKVIWCNHKFPVSTTLTPSGEHFVRNGSGGQDIESDVTIALVKAAQRTKVTISNANDDFAANISKLNIRGTALSGGGIEQVEGNVSVGFLPQSKTLRFSDNSGNTTNLYIQSRSQAEFIKSVLTDHTSKHRSKFSVRCLGDPTLQPRDLVSVNTPELGTKNGYILRHVWEFSNKFTSTFTVVGNENWTPYTASDLHQMDVDQIDDNKKAFY